MLPAAATAPEQRPTEARKDRTVAHAHAAMSSLLRHAIPPSPRHFAVWYDYHAGDTAMVRTVIDSYLTNGQGITEGLLHDIHDRFLEQRRESCALTETALRLRQATEQVIGLLAEAGGDTARYGSALGAFGGALAAEGGDLQGMLHGIITETLDMAQRSAALGSRLEESARVVSDLQARLDAATREARTDALTGLPNRRAVEDAAAALAQDAGPPLALAVFDIDRFKAVNDTWGHPVGDAVLRHVAGTLRAALEEGMICGRIGGEEFVVLMPGRDLAAALEVAERVRIAVGQQSVQVRASGRTLGAVTLSGGVAARQPGEAWAALLARADAALYRAKQTGRNRVVGEAA